LTMKPGLVLVTPPEAEPILAADALAFLRVDDTDEQTLVEGLIKAARIYVENYTGLTLINTVWALWRDGFSKRRLADPWWNGTRDGSLSMFSGGEERKIVLPRKPVVSVTSISTFGLDDTESTYAASNYIVDDTKQNPEIVLRDAAVWPSDLRAAKAVKVLFTAGYGTVGTSVPADILLAMRHMIAHWFENRESVVVGSIAQTATVLLETYRCIDL